MASRDISVALSNDKFKPLGLSVAGVPIFYDGRTMQLIEHPTLWMFSLALNQPAIQSPRTWKAYAESLLDWMRHVEANGWNSDEVSQSHLGAYRQHMLNSKTIFGRNTGARTINARIGVVTRYYRWLNAMGTIPKYPFALEYRALNRKSLLRGHAAINAVAAKVSSVRVRELVPQRIPKPILISVLSFLKAGGRERDRLIVEWALATGMRRFEILALLVAQLPNSAHLRGVDFPQFTITDTKYAIARRVKVPISLLDRTLRYVNSERARIVRKCGSKNVSPKLFLSESGACVSKATVYKHYREALGNSEYRFHDLRHTFAVHRYQQLCSAKAARPESPFDPLKVLQAELGHKSLQATQIYIESMKLDTSAVDEMLLNILEEVDP